MNKFYKHLYSGGECEHEDEDDHGHLDEKHKNYWDSDSDEEQAKKKPCKERVLVSHKSTWKPIFDFFVMLLIIYSSLTSMFFVAFPAHPTHEMELIMETEDIVFTVDLLFNFFTSYVDPKTYDVVKDHWSIAINYLNGWFLIDLCSIFPFHLLLHEHDEAKAMKTLRLLKLTKLPRLIKLLKLVRLAKLGSFL